MKPEEQIGWMPCILKPFNILIMASHANDFCGTTPIQINVDNHDCQSPAVFTWIAGE